MLLLTLLAKGGALLPGYAIDDYGVASDGPGVGLLADVLSKGRVGHWLFLKAALALQAEPNAARILYVSFAIVAYAAFGLAVVRFWGVHGRGWLPVLAAAIVANHPYTCEIFTFRIGLPLAAIVVALLAFLLYLAGRPRPHLVLGSLIFAFASSFYQIALHFAFMVFLLGTAIELCRRASEPSNSPPRPRLRDDPTARLFLYIVCGGLAYSLGGALFGRMIGVSGHFFETLPLERIPERLVEVARYVYGTFADPNVLVPPAVQAAFGLVVACLLLGFLRLVSRPAGGRSLLRVTAVVALLAVALLWSVGVFLFLEGYWPVPRNMAHMGILWGGCLVLAALAAPWRWLGVTVGAAAAVILLSFIGVNEHILDEQRRLNMRDLLQANRIVARMESLPGFEKTRRVAFSGGRAWYPMGLQRTQWGDMNISAFSAVWSQVAVLREATGYDLQWSTDEGEKAAAAAYCAAVEPWPALQSVVLRGEVAFVCFGQPRTP